MVNFSVPWLDPGESYEAKQIMKFPARFERLIAKPVGDWPIRVLYQKKTGGSRRKGKRYSLLYSLDTIAHARGRTPNLSIDDVYVGRTNQLVGIASIPLDVFSPEYSPDLNMDAADEGMMVRLSFTNREEYRRAQASVALVGYSIAHDEQSFPRGW